MAIITIASSKGGCCKTTVARLLLGHGHQAGLRVGAVDADLNHSLAEWCHRHGAPWPCVAEIDETRIVPQIEAMTEGRDLVVIDTAGAATQATVFAIGCADLVLVPLRLSAADVTEAVKTMALVASAGQMMRRPIPARVVLSGFKPRTGIGAHVEGEVATAGLTPMATRLHDLVAFEEMSFNGQVPTAGPAGLQAQALFSEAMALLGLANYQPMKLVS